MLKRLIITKKQDTIITSYFKDEQLIELNCSSINQKIIGNIYIGKVKNIVKNIQSAFIDIGLDQNAYFSLQDNKTILYTNHKTDTHLAIGDEIIVQVTKESTKTKGPVVTSHLNLTGRYIVLTVGKNLVGVSSKITDEELRRNLRQHVKSYVTSDYGFIVRTNAMYTDMATITDEINFLIKKYEHIKKIGQYRTCFELIEKAPTHYITSIRDHYTHQLDTIITDDQEIFDTVNAFLKDYELQQLTVKLHKDENISLFDLYSLKTKINQALLAKVWLKSGGYIVIQPTEALISIDVNTGKYVGKKNFEDTVFKINLEAAKEISKQLRLRNLSGIIVVDFIDMKNEKHKKTLMRTFEEHLLDDPIKTTLVSMTHLNLVELTRKKVRKPIYEQFGKLCPFCKGNSYTFDL